MDKSRRKLKIALVFDDSLDKPDGVQQYLLSLGAWLNAAGHEVHYLVGQTKRNDIPRLHSLSHNLGVSFNGNQLSIPLPTSRRKLKALLIREMFDVLHVQMPYSPWLAHRIIIAAPSGTLIFGTFHIVAYSKLVQIATRGLAIWTSRSLRRFKRVVSVSSAAADYAFKTYAIQTDVLPNVIDYPRFNRATPFLPKAAANLRILFLGRLVDRKGCADLLAAIRLLQDQGQTGYEVVICGKGPLQGQLSDYAIRHRLPVTFTGFVSEADKPGYFASADIAVFPSRGGESFGIVLIEAMASGKAAVLAANNSGYSSVMKDRPELLVPVAEPAALAERIGFLLAHPEARAAAAKWGEQYSRQFDVSVVGARLLAEYQTALLDLRNTDER